MILLFERESILIEKNPPEGELTPQKWNGNKNPIPLFLLLYKYSGIEILYIINLIYIIAKTTYSPEQIRSSRQIQNT
jgi:hypothetical protein